MRPSQRTTAACPPFCAELLRIRGSSDADDERVRLDRRALARRLVLDVYDPAGWRRASRSGARLVRRDQPEPDHDVAPAGGDLARRADGGDAGVVGGDRASGLDDRGRDGRADRAAGHRAGGVDRRDRLTGPAAPGDPLLRERGVEAELVARDEQAVPGGVRPGVAGRPLRTLAALRSLAALRPQTALRAGR